MAGPFLPNLDPIIQAGIDPKTGLPVKLVGPGSSYLKDNIVNCLSVVDRQDAVNRFCWENLPAGLTSDLLERILYYKGQGIFFYMSANDRYYFLPYTLCGNIDVYGRWMQVTPLPFAGGKTDSDKPWISGLIKVPVYDELDEGSPEDACVIIKDYTNAIEQTIVPRSILNKPLIDVEADCIPFLRTALINATGVMGVRVSDESQYQSVLDASKAVDNAALTGNKYVPIIGSIEFQELAGSGVARSEEFLMTMQSLDNLRLQTLGISNGGLFQKKEHVLQSENDLNTQSQNITLEDGLKNRQAACDIINRVFGLDISVSVNEVQPQEPIAYEEDVEEMEDENDTL